MSGKKVIITIIVITVVAIIATWIYGQKVIKDLDLDRGMDTPSTITVYKGDPFPLI
ncbi:MAG TPA: hypothetical protein VK144_07800 [Bacillota bacterium]|nr:hypothetical protein [Bacillota bacterium]